MANTLDDLITPETSDDVLQFFLTQLAAPGNGFPVTAWQTGGVIYTLLRVQAQSIADVVSTVAQVAAGGLVQLATGGWLDLLARSAYNLTRVAATFALGTVLVTNAGAGSVTLSAGQLWITDALGHRYNAQNTSPVTIAASGSSVLSFKAESPGAAYNLANGTTVTLVTPIPGVTAALSVVSPATSWLTTQGADTESDENLRIRCWSRWATVGILKTTAAYLNLAGSPNTGASTLPTRIYVDDANPRGAGTVDVWVAGPAGALSSPDLALVSSYVLARKSPATDVQVANAAPVTIDISADLYAQSNYTQAAAQAASNLTALVNAVALGGVLSYAEVIAQIVAPSGAYDAQNILVNGGSANLALAVNQVAVPGTFTITLHSA